MPRYLYGEASRSIPLEKKGLVRLDMSGSQINSFVVS